MRAAVGHRLRLTALLLLIAVPGPARADPAEDVGAPAETVRVDAAVDGATLHLSDGRDLRLIGIEPPSPLPGANGPRTLSARATRTLSDLARGRAVTLQFPQAPDRYGRLWGQVQRADDGLWLQDALLRQGLARVVPMPASRSRLGEMLAAEAAARAARRGIWATDAFAVRRPGALRAGLGDFLIVEGRVLEVADRKTLLCLTLGPTADPADEAAPADGRAVASGDEVEVLLPRGVRAEFAALGIDPALAKGWDVRARGWLERRDGIAQLVLAQREQLEFVGDGGGDRR